ncbi:hydroxyacylglutathione hydrolase [Algicella marina]|uniref:Hydroxyacylglutathione hydrolase n=1 Tax=Algicella marina TaxID=2683284 RepID=A0A6P1T4M2_9RHOB|nr:hydroxyacylglutathione hydrolase [Algicella marina]QHQ36219.1 hydroxyacylglutathione hydrolase [Algicella marina]
MAPTILTITCRTDNYAFLIHDEDTGETALVDAPEAAPIIAALEEKGWNLDTILITHHHPDHVEGVDELRQRYGSKVVGGKADAHRLPALDVAVAEGDKITVTGHPVQVIDVSGHTVGHIAFYMPAASAVFTADSLMALGCGRLFEGTAAQMWESLSKLATLPDDTTVCSGHEYTEANARFALTVDPGNEALKARAHAVAAARAVHEPTVPSTLAEEKETNPFLRAADPDIRAYLDMEDATDVEVFAEIRKRKDNF